MAVTNLPSSAGASVRIERLSKRYATGGSVVAALSDVSLGIEAGSFVAVTGPSGSGKSTLLHLLGAMESPDAGKIVVGRTRVTALSRAEQAAYRRRIGFVFQRFHLLPALTALDNVAAPLLPHRTRFDKHERARELLSRVGLGGRERAFPAELSGGEQQRVAIARALVNDPVLALADEPTGNLDSQTGAGILDLLLEVRATLGTTVVLATHDALIASRSDRIVRLRDGCVVDDVEVPREAESHSLLERISRIE